MQRVKKTFYSNKKLYVAGTEYDTADLNDDILEEYFEEQPQAKKTRKKKVQKSKSSPKTNKTTKTMEDNKKKEPEENMKESPSEEMKKVESVQSPATADKEPSIKKEKE